MPYKVEKGKVSFQCGTLSQKRLQVQHLVLRQKLLPHLLWETSLVDTFQLLISLSKQFAPGSSPKVLIMSADSQIQVVDDIDPIHKFKGINKIIKLCLHLLFFLFFFYYLLTRKCLIHEIFVLNLVDMTNIIVPPKVDAFLHFLEFSMVLSLCKVLKIALNLMALVLHG